MSFSDFAGGPKRTTHAPVSGGGGLASVNENNSSSYGASGSSSGSGALGMISDSLLQYQVCVCACVFVCLCGAVGFSWCWSLIENVPPPCGWGMLPSLPPAPERASFVLLDVLLVSAYFCHVGLILAFSVHSVTLAFWKRLYIL